MKTYIKIILCLIAVLTQSAQAERLYGLERMERLDRLPYLLEGTQVRQVSSHDRSGGNDDGFSGVHSALYVDESGEYVLFDEIGAGCLYRFWMTYASSPADYADRHLRFYFDNETVPRLDLSIADFFDGIGAPLEFPMVGPFNSSSHGCYCYLPFPYQERLKITLSDLPFFYQMTYHRYDSPDDDVVSWTGNEDRSVVMGQWNAAGADPKSSVSNLLVSGNQPVLPGATGTLFSVVGEGTIQSTKLDPSPNTTNILSDVWIQMNWDGGESEVDVPLGDFFGSGRYEINVTSLPIGMKTSGDWYCYFPMPYWESAEIRLVNKGSEALTALPFEIQYTTNACDPGKSGLFHALFHETAVSNGVDVNFINERGRGHVVGLSLFMESSGGGGYRDMTYLEGDERVYVDGALSPCIHGTGTEDYFNCGWYFNWGMFSRAYHGFPWGDQFNTNSPNYTQAYRFHLSDIIPFDQSVKFGIEHGHANSAPGIYSSVIYYYKLPGPSSGMVLSADLDLGDEWSETIYNYQFPPNWLEIANNWNYEGDDDTIAVVDEGYHYSGAIAEFTVPMIDNNIGLLLRRRTDQGIGGQKAHVFVDDSYAGIWYEADHNFSNSTKRWLDSEFMVSSNLVAGKTSARITVVPLLSASTWNEYRYWVYCIKPFGLIEDFDGDQLPDEWEFELVGSLDVLNASADFDSDGFSDLDEYIAGTHPTNPASFFTMQSGNIVDSRIGHLYHLQESTNLVYGDWQTIRSNIPGTGTLLEIPTETTAPAAFYRLQVEKP